MPAPKQGGICLAKDHPEKMICPICLQSYSEPEHIYHHYCVDCDKPLLPNSVLLQFEKALPEWVNGNHDSVLADLAEMWHEHEIHMPTMMICYTCYDITSAEYMWSNHIYYQIKHLPGKSCRDTAIPLAIWKRLSEMNLATSGICGIFAHKINPSDWTKTKLEEMEFEPVEPETPLRPHTHNLFTNQHLNQSLRPA